MVYWNTRLNSGNLDGLRTAERTGRLGSIDGSTEEEIRTELSRSDHLKTSDFSGMVQETFGVTYIRKHIRRIE